MKKNLKLIAVLTCFTIVFNPISAKAEKQGENSFDVGAITNKTFVEEERDVEQNSSLNLESGTLDDKTDTSSNVQADSNQGTVSNPKQDFIDNIKGLSGIDCTPVDSNSTDYRKYHISTGVDIGQDLKNYINDVASHGSSTILEFKEYSTDFDPGVIEIIPPDYDPNVHDYAYMWDDSDGSRTGNDLYLYNHPTESYKINVKSNFIDIPSTNYTDKYKEWPDKCYIQTNWLSPAVSPVPVIETTLENKENGIAIINETGNTKVSVIREDVLTKEEYDVKYTASSNNEFMWYMYDNNMSLIGAYKTGENRLKLQVGDSAKYYVNCFQSQNQSVYDRKYYTSRYYVYSEETQQLIGAWTEDYYETNWHPEAQCVQWVQTFAGTYNVATGGIISSDADVIFDTQQIK